MMMQKTVLRSIILKDVIMSLLTDIESQENLYNFLQDFGKRKRLYA
jgi:hypothetical protein